MSNSLCFVNLPVVEGFDLLVVEGLDLSAAVELDLEIVEQVLQVLRNFDRTYYLQGL